MLKRRQFIGWSTAAGLLLALPITAGSKAGGLKPMRLRPGDKVAIVALATVTYEQLEVRLAVETLEAMGLEAQPGRHVLERFGYFAGRDQQRADDFNKAVHDSSIKAIFCLRGGWGSSRLLPLLDYEALAENPKILLGYSDITSLLNAVHAKTGLITFHGPNVWSEWNEFALESMRGLLFEARAMRYVNPREAGDDLVAKQNRIQTIVPGTARGELIGGNLSLVCGLLGTPYLPSFEHKILFLEDVGEAVYRVDRLLTQLGLSGEMKKLSGIVFGQFSRIVPKRGLGDFSLMDVLRQHFEPLGLPCYYGAMFGHIAQNSTLPIGIPASMDASRGELELLEPAVL